MSWRDKHACTACGTGYGHCAEYVLIDLKCCAHCDHPGRWTADPYTDDEIREMWQGQDMPAHVRERLNR